MTTTHTPGPWVIKDGDIRDGRPRGRTIAKIRTYDYGWTLPQHMAEQDANTRLLAAAPDLLAALQAVAAWWYSTPSANPEKYGPHGLRLSVRVLSAIDKGGGEE